MVQRRRHPLIPSIPPSVEDTHLFSQDNSIGKNQLTVSELEGKEGIEGVLDHE